MHCGLVQRGQSSLWSELASEFALRIGACLESVAPQKSRPDWHESASDDPSIWLGSTTPLHLNEDWGSGIKTLIDGGRWYVRILPSKFDPAAIDDGAYAPISSSYMGRSSSRATGGTLSYSGSVRAHDISNQLDGATMWFRSTGELWAFQTSISAEYRGRLSFYGDYVPEKWIDILRHGLAFLSNNGGAGPYHVRLGVTQLEGLYWSEVNMWAGLLLSH